MLLRANPPSRLHEGGKEVGIGWLNNPGHESGVCLVSICLRDEGTGRKKAARIL